jgi:hypothetical protein
MAKYQVEYVLQTVHLITVEAEDEQTASDLANDIDLADWKETDCETIDYIVTELPEGDE